MFLANIIYIINNPFAPWVRDLKIGGMKLFIAVKNTLLLIEYLDGTVRV